MDQNLIIIDRLENFLQASKLTVNALSVNSHCSDIPRTGNVPTGK